MDRSVPSARTHQNLFLAPILRRPCAAWHDGDPAAQGCGDDGGTSMQLPRRTRWTDGPEGDHHARRGRAHRARRSRRGPTRMATRSPATRPGTSSRPGTTAACPPPTTRRTSSRSTTRSRRCGATSRRRTSSRTSSPRTSRPSARPGWRRPAGPDSTILYDQYGIAHVTGKTRADVAFGAGWVTARDRNLLLTLGPGPGTGGGGRRARHRRLLARHERPAVRAERRGRGAGHRAAGPDRQAPTARRAAEILADAQAEADGVNAYWRGARHRQPAGHRQRRDRDHRLHRLDLRRRRRR